MCIRDSYRININNVARRAIRRYTTRIRAKLRRAQIALARSTHQGHEHNNNTINKKLDPVARIDDDCTQITWHPTVMSLSDHMVRIAVRRPQHGVK